MKGEKITTKKGDYGYTQFRGKKISKDDPIIELIGTIDELQSFLGFASYILNSNKKTLKKIEKLLYNVMSYIYTRDKRFLPSEKEIEKLYPKIEIKNNFTIPTGKCSILHICRTIARRAERRAVGAKVAEIIPFLNRLSDLLFLMAENCSKKSKNHRES